MQDVKEEIKQMAQAAIREKPSARVLPIVVGEEKYWVKRKLGNGRNQLVKYSVEKEFYYEIARMTIVGKNCPDLVPEFILMTPTYMVTRDGGPTVKEWMDRDISEEEKETLLERAGQSLARLHDHGIVHGRPALRDMTWNGEKLTFLDWENRLYGKTVEEQKGLDLLLMLQGICREDYPEEPGRVAAVLRGYTRQGGEKTLDTARAFLRKHSLIGKLTEKLAPFKMVDIESVRKLYEYLLKQ